ncbi:hypothetical protein HS088_TW21G01382 [Tripterygium wilfordii]|uniref:VQ domain-containing protein n=1 Tax=Tripterygium wilfordii TaxID=458696 RepID=A0A7J7C515_TRIWF|nr:VQ motif-containing protein 22-like [Tripterygium wilfordii]KAF5729223.1 hypothetical protein HS088_TW21G01382 [Tripterygium wilfordii]
MEDIITGSTQWVQSSYDSFHSLLPFSDATAPTTGVDSSLLSPNKSCRAIDHHQHQLSPRNSGCVSKPIRRRSRASKRTPTTLLKANTTNFRALVQQFTGCPRAPIPFATQKGPITLNFGAGSAHNYNYSSSTNFRKKFYLQRFQRENWSQQNEQQQQHQQYLQQQEQQEYYSVEQILDNISNDGSNSGSQNVEIDDDFVLNDFSLDELTREYLFSNDICS